PSGAPAVPDAVLVVRGRLDHKERGDSKLLVQEIEVFQPTEDEVAKARAARELGPVVLKVNAAPLGPSLIEELKAIFHHNPGDAEVEIELETRDGTRRLRFGSGYRRRPRAGAGAWRHRLHVGRRGGSRHDT